MRKSFTILCLLIAVLSYGQTAQVQWYVSTAGDDVAGNGTLVSPYKTVTNAATKLTAGDTLFVMGGIYANTSYHDGYYWKDEVTAKIVSRNGTASQYIVIMPYQNQTVVFKGDGQFVFQVQSSSYIKVQGFEIYGETENIPLPLSVQYQFAFRRTANTGINTSHELRLPVGTSISQSGLEDLTPYTIYRPYYFFTHGVVVQGSNHIDIVNNKVHHMPGEGIRFAGSDYINCERNEVYHCSQRSSTGVHGISCYNMQSADNNAGTKIFFRRNLVHDNYNEVMSWSEQKTIFTAEMDEGKGLTVQRTYAANGWTHGRILFENNIAYRNGLSGIHVNEGDRVDIINNTVYQNNRYGFGNNLGISVGGNDFRIYNNIVESDLSWGGYTIAATAGTTGLVVENNLVNGNLDNDINAVDVSTTVATAQFVNAAAYDFRLLAGSQAINNSLASAAPSRDYNNFLRDAQPDRGAFEFGSVLPLQLFTFSGQSLQDVVLLSWQTVTESGFSHFDIQHSTDNSRWEYLGTVKGMGVAHKYNYADFQPVTGNNYYRLKMVDFDNTISYSGVVNMKFSKGLTVSIFPNPAINVINVKGFQGNAAFQLFSADGRDLTSQIRVTVTENCHKVNIQDIIKGVYLLKSGSRSLLFAKIN